MQKPSNPSVFLPSLPTFAKWIGPGTALVAAYIDKQLRDGKDRPDAHPSKAIR
jgi:hypothetical protein